MRRIVLDQGLSPKAAVILRSDQWDAVHVRELGMSEAEDADILAFAARESRVLVTLDRDFPQILALTAARQPSVILIRQLRLRAADVAQLLASLWTEHESALDRGCVLSTSARGTRLRALPLG